MRRNLICALLALGLITGLTGTRALAGCEVLQGPCLEERKALLKRIELAENRGVGTAPYIQAFELINQSVRDGVSRELIAKQTKVLSLKISEQISYIRPEPTPWEKFAEHAIYRIRKSWNPRRDGSTVIVTSNVSPSGEIKSMIVSETSKQKDSENAALQAVREGLPARKFATKKGFVARVVFDTDAYIDRVILRLNDNDSKLTRVEVLSWTVIGPCVRPPESTSAKDTDSTADSSSASKGN